MHQKTGILIISLILFLLTVSILPREIELQYHEIRQKYDPDFNKVARLGFKKIIVRSFLNNGLSGGLLFENNIFKVAYPGFSEIIKKNRNRIFNLWGWLISRKYDWLETDELYDSRFSKGRRSKIRKLDLFIPAVREKIIEVFKNLAGSGVEGILIQDDLSFASDEGFSDTALRIFSEESSVPAKEKLMIESGSPYNLKWISIKNKLINTFLADIVKECRRVNPEIKIGINVYYEASIQKSRGNEWHSQDLAGIAGSDVDYIYLMMYHRQMKKELKLGKDKIKQLFRDGIETAHKIAGDRLVIKMETWDWNKSELIPINEMEEYIRLIPERIRYVCFTPVKNSGIKYLKRLFEAAKN